MPLLSIILVNGQRIGMSDFGNKIISGYAYTELTSGEDRSIADIDLNNVDEDTFARHPAVRLDIASFKSEDWANKPIYVEHDEDKGVVGNILCTYRENRGIKIVGELYNETHFQQQINRRVDAGELHSFSVGYTTYMENG